MATASRDIALKFVRADEWVPACAGMTKEGQSGAGAGRVRHRSRSQPPGDPTPSLADLDMTKKVIDAGARLGVAVHDHVVIGRKGNTSMRQQGLI